MASQVTGERHFYPFLIWDCAAVVKIRSEKFQEIYIFAQFFQNAETFKTERITISPFIVNPLYLITHCFPILHKMCASRMTTYMLLQVGTKYDKYIKKLSGYRNPY